MNNGDLVVYVPKDSDGNVYKCQIGKIKRIDGDSAFVSLILLTKLSTASSTIKSSESQNNMYSPVEASNPVFLA